MAYKNIEFTQMNKKEIIQGVYKLMQKLHAAAFLIYF